MAPIPAESGPLFPAKQAFSYWVARFLWKRATLQITTNEEDDNVRIQKEESKRNADSSCSDSNRLNPETRRSGGMHYTNIENIHKVIDPLFLNSLRAELDEIKTVAVNKTRDQKLRAFQAKIAGLKFLENCTTSLIRIQAAWTEGSFFGQKGLVRAFLWSRVFTRLFFVC